MKLTTLIAITATVFGACVLEGCGDAAPSQAPPITGKPFKKWKDLTPTEKIAALERSPDPMRAQHEEMVREGKY